MPFAYARTVRFADTDAAGVVYFPRYLSMCHEAYEESLAAAGVPIASFLFEYSVIVPVSKCEASYQRPLVCGDKLRVELTPRLVSDNTYAINYVIWKLGIVDKRAATLRTEHVCISAKTRERQLLPANLLAWVQAG